MWRRWNKSQLIKAVSILQIFVRRFRVRSRVGICAIACLLSVLCAPLEGRGLNTSTKLTDAGAEQSSDGGGAATTAANETLDFPTLNSGQGSAPGSAAIDQVSSSTGAYSFSVPIELPPGVNDLAPSVSIMYSSDAGRDSLIAPGFVLAAYDCIFRQSPPRYDFAGKALRPLSPPDFTDQDTFYLGGSRLVACSDTASCPSGTFRTETNNFERVEKQPVDGARGVNLPNGWMVTKSDGSIVEYNEPVYMDDLIVDFNHTVAFCQSRVLKGNNEIRYTYDHPAPGLKTLRSIQYGGQAGANNHQWQIDFGWSDRSDVVQGYRTGGLTKITKRLQSIDVTAINSGARLYRYWLTYDASPSATGKYHLLNIQQFGSDDSASYPAYTFTYSPDVTGFAASTTISSGLNPGNYFTNDRYFDIFYVTSGNTNKDWVLNDHQSTLALDVNRDGFPDLVRRDSIGSAIWLNNAGKGFIYSDTWTSKVNTLPSFGWLGNTWSSQLYVTAAGLNAAYANYNSMIDGGVRLADLNGDGYPDVIAAADNNCSNNQPTYWVGLWNPSAGGGTGAWEANAAAGRFKDTLQSSGIRFTNYRLKNDCGKYYVRNTGVFVIDVNGDGLADIVSTGIYGRRTLINKGDRFVEDGSWAVPMTFVGYPDDAAHNKYYDVDWGYRFGDVNGDGLPDIALALRTYDDSNGSNGTSYDVWVNTGRGWTENSGLATSLRTAGRSSSPEAVFTSVHYHFPADQNTYDYKNFTRGLTLVDVNGDGKDDLVRSECLNGICGPYENVYLNTGSGWGASDASQWHLPFQMSLSNGGHWENGSYVSSYDFDTGLRWVDVNGDGTLEPLQNSGSFWFGNGARTYTNKSRFDRDLITGVKTPLGSSATISYTQINSANGHPTLPFSKTLVSSITLNNGGGAGAPLASLKKDFFCYGAAYDPNEKKFLGCKVFSVREPLESDVVENGFSSPSQYHFSTSWMLNSPNDFCRKGAVRRTVVSSKLCDGSDGVSGTRCLFDQSNNYEPIDLEANGIDYYRVTALRPRKVSDNFYDSCASGEDPPYFHPVKASDEILIDPGNQILRHGLYRTFEYGEFGNRTKESEFLHRSDTSPSRIISTTFTTPNTSAWVVSKTCGTTLSDGQANPLRGTETYYDGSASLCSAPTDGWMTKAVTIGYPANGEPEVRITTQFSYNPITGNLESITNGRNNSTTTEWNSTFPNIFPSRKTNAKSQSSSFTYDAYGNLADITDVNNITSHIRYDKLQRISESWIDSSDDPSQHVTFQYALGNPNAQYLGSTRSIDGTRIVQDVTRFDGFGRKYLSLTHAGARTIAQSFSYNTRGLQYQTTVPYQADAPSDQVFRLDKPLTKTQYDPEGVQVLVTRPGGYHAQSVSSFLDELDLFTTEVTVDNDPVPIKRVLYHDLMGRLVQVSENPGEANEQITKYQYDAANNQTDVCLSDGSGDCGSNATRIKRFYDGLGRLIGLKDPDSSNCTDANVDNLQSGCPWRFSYDANGNLATSEDPAYRISTSAGTRIVFTYDELDRLRDKSASNGTTVYRSTFTYDSSNSQCAGTEDWPLGRLTGVDYQTIPASGNQVGYCLSYDRLGRTKHKHSSVAVPSATPVAADIAYTYFPNGDVHTRATSFGAQSDTATYWYDDFARPYSVTSSSLGTSVVSAITYNALGQELYRYYRNSGEGLRYTYRNGDSSSPAGDLRVSNIHALNSSAQFDLTYDYYPSGSVKSVVDGISGRDEEFKYDSLNRLVQYSHGTTQVEAFDYDSLGNRITSTAGAAAQQVYGVKYSYNPPGSVSILQPARKLRLLTPSPIMIEEGSSTPTSTAATLANSALYYQYGHSFAGGGGSHALRCIAQSPTTPCSSADIRMTYDYNGNLLTEYNAVLGKQTTYNYNFENKLSYVGSGSTSSAYYYGPYGEKVAESDNGVLTFYLESGIEIRGNHPAYVYRIGSDTAAIIENGVPRFVYSDVVGSTRRVVNGSTNLLDKSLDYYPFGVPYNSSGSYNPRYTFGGEEMNALNVSDFGARSYLPAYGRFIQPDTITPDLSNPQTINRYSYVMNNPGSGVDPSGRIAILDDLVYSFLINSFVFTATGHFASPNSPSEGGLKPMIINGVITFPTVHVDSTRKKPGLHSPGIQIKPEFGAFLWLSSELFRAFKENFALHLFHDDIYDMMMYFTPVPYVWTAVNMPGTFVSNVTEDIADEYFGSESTEGVVLGTAASFFAPDPSDALFEVPLAERATVRMTRVRMLGRAGEEAFERMTGVALNKGEGMSRFFINGRTRIPDAITRTHIYEVKNVERLTSRDVKQIRDSIALAENSGRRFALYIRPAESLSQRVPEDLLRMYEQGKIEIHMLTPLDNSGLFRVGK